VVQLKVTRDGVEYQNLDLKEVQGKSVTIGRGEEAELKLDDRSVGRKHAVLIHENGIWKIKRESKFGKVLVNGNEVDEAKVTSKDVIKISDYQLKIIEKDLKTTSVNELNKKEPTLNVQDGLVQEAQGVEGVLSSQDGFLGQEAKFEQEGLLGQDAIPKEESVESSENPVDSSSNFNNEGVNLESDSSASQNFNGSNFEMGLNPSIDSDGGDKTSVLNVQSLSAKLKVIAGTANVEEIELKDGEFFIGRSQECQLSISDKGASRKHCKIIKQGSNFILQDLGSGNGTYVNNQKVDEALLNSGDIIEIGETKIQFEAINLEYKQIENSLEQVDDSLPEEILNTTQDGSTTNSTDQSFSVGQAPIDNSQGMELLKQEVSLNSGMSSIAGLSNNNSNKKESLLEKFKRQPLMRKILIVVGILGALLFLVDDDSSNKTKGKNSQNQKKAGQSSDPFNALPPEKKQFVVNYYQVATDYFKNKEYEKAIYEFKKIEEILPNGYKDSKELVLLAERTLSEMKRREEEAKRIEAKKKLEQELSQYVLELEDAVKKLDEQRAKQILMKIFERDPDHAAALRLKQELEDKIRQKEIEEKEKQELEEKRKRLEAVIRDGEKLFKEGKYFEVISRMEDAPTVGYNDKKLLDKAKKLALDAKNKIQELLRPHLEEGQKALKEKNYAKARDSFYKALSIDDQNEEALQGLEQVKTELREQARRIYIDGILAESLNDFETAKQKYKECMENSMKDDLYYSRCLRKGKRLDVNFGEEEGQREVATSKQSDSPVPATHDLSGNNEGDPQMPSFESSKKEESAHEN
jgi:pSer/pThr/pTyr-binding forkhead associated (FHA) protein